MAISWTGLLAVVAGHTPYRMATPSTVAGLAAASSAMAQRGARLSALRAVAAPLTPLTATATSLRHHSTGVARGLPPVCRRVPLGSAAVLRVDAALPAALGATGVQSPRRLFASAAAAAASPASPPSSASAAGTVTALASNLASPADAQDLFIAYGGASAAVPSVVRPLAVVKVGGEVITKDLPALVASLKFLSAFGLQPVVIHGGGPQLNDELAKAGVSPQYIGGHRVTDGPTMAVAKRVFESANAVLTAGLVAGGLDAAPLLGGIFHAAVPAGSQLGLVGEIHSVDADPVNALLAAGRIPVLTSIGVDAAGGALNINADVAARELAVVLKPMKVGRGDVEAVTLNYYGSGAAC